MRFNAAAGASDLHHGEEPELEGLEVAAILRENQRTSQSQSIMSSDGVAIKGNAT